MQPCEIPLQTTPPFCAIISADFQTFINHHEIISIRGETNMMLNLKGLVAKIRLSQNEKGQGLVEYALILVLVAIVVIAVLLTLGPVVSGSFFKVLCGMNGPYCAGPYTPQNIPEPAALCTRLGSDPGGQIWFWDIDKPVGAGPGDTWTIWVTTTNKYSPASGAVLWPDPANCP
jgi:pilus assembly protein Flp/PilA